MTGDQNDIFARLKGYLPTRWFGAPSDTSPVIDAVLMGVASVLAFVYGLYVYAKQQTRIATATDGWLDLIAADYLGTGLPRKAGESDASYRARIQANLFREKATRNAIIQTLTALTGRAPQIIEPQRPADTGAYGHNPPALLVGASIYRSDWQGNQLLYPTSRTNLLPYSTDLSHWSASNAALSSGSVAPDGVSTMTRITASTASANAQATETVSVTDGATYTLSAYVRRDQNRYAKLFGFGNGSGGAVIDLQTGATQINSTWLSAGVDLISTQIARIYGVVQPISSGQANIGLAANMAGTGTIAAGAFLDAWGAQLEAGGARTAMIATGASAASATDYTVNSVGQVTFSTPPAISAALTVTSPSDGLPAGTPLGTGTGYTTTFSATAPTGPYAPVGYGVAGAYGSLSLAYQAFVVAYRPRSAGTLASVAGYGISTGGYGAPSRASYLDLTQVTGGITDSDIFAAVDAVKPAGTIVWTTIQN